MYEVYAHARKEACGDAGDALNRAVMCAVQGREASVVGENGELIGSSRSTRSRFRTPLIVQRSCISAARHWSKSRDIPSRSFLSETHE